MDPRLSIEGSARQSVMEQAKKVSKKALQMVKVINKAPSLRTKLQTQVIGSRHR